MNIFRRICLYLRWYNYFVLTLNTRDEAEIIFSLQLQFFLVVLSSVYLNRKLLNMCSEKEFMMREKTISKKSIHISEINMFNIFLNYLFNGIKKIKKKYDKQHTNRLLYVLIYINKLLNLCLCWHSVSVYE